MEEINNKGIVKNMIFITLFEILLSIVLIFILSILLSFTSLEENIIKPSIIGISTFSIMLGGFILSKKLKRKGLFFGALQGIIYMFLLYFISSIILSDFSISFEALIMVILGIVGGIIGGIIGVNLK